MVQIPPRGDLEVESRLMVLSRGRELRHGHVEKRPSCFHMEGWRLGFGFRALPEYRCSYVNEFQKKENNSILWSVVIFEIINPQYGIVCQMASRNKIRKQFHIVVSFWFWSNPQYAIVGQMALRPPSKPIWNPLGPKLIKFRSLTGLCYYFVTKIQLTGTTAALCGES